MARLKTVLILILVTVITLITMAITVKPNSKLMNTLGYVGYVIKPVQSVLTTISDGTKSVVDFFPRYNKLDKENKRLAKKVELMDEKLRKYNDAMRENARLKELLDIKNQHENMEMKAAQVIAKDPGNWFDTFIINKGKNDGVKANMPIITRKGLVGYVISVGPNFAKVMSILDIDCSVSAIISRTRDNGMVTGDESVESKGYIRMNYIGNTSKITTDDSVETSGMGEIFPKGISIGKVVAIKRDSDQLTKYALIKPYVDFKKIEEVLIIVKRN